MVKIDGTNGIDVAQLRSPDGDPVAMTIDALGKLAFPTADFNSSNNGFAVLTNNLMIAWGASTSDGAGNATFGFQGQTFATVPRVFCQLIGNGSNAGATSVEAVTTTQVTVKTTNGGTVGPLTFGWIAIGYKP
jgi:hypothetical protein